MQNPLTYQSSEYDCGPTAVLNAIRYLFRREDIPPVMIKAVYHYTLDGFNAQGESGKSGTSAMAMQFVSHWLNQYGKQVNFPVRSEFYSGSDVWLTPDCPLCRCLRDGGAAVIRLWYGCPHYVTATAVNDHQMMLFDPYYRVEPFHVEGVSVDHDHPLSYNRIVSLDRMMQCKKRAYSLYTPETRELLLIYNTSKDPNHRNTPENYCQEDEDEDDDLE